MPHRSWFEATTYDGSISSVARFPHRVVASAADSFRRRDADPSVSSKRISWPQVAHELRQALIAVVAAAGLLEATPTESIRQRAIGTILRQTNHLKLLVGDLLDLSRLSRHELQLHNPRSIYARPLMMRWPFIALDVAARRIDLSTSIRPYPVYLDADPARVRQILSNLLSNAVKFTPEGGKIVLTLESPGNRNEFVVMLPVAAQQAVA